MDDWHGHAGITVFTIAPLYHELRPRMGNQPPLSPPYTITGEQYPTSFTHPLHANWQCNTATRCNLRARRRSSTTTQQSCDQRVRDWQPATLVLTGGTAAVEARRLTKTLHIMWCCAASIPHTVSNTPRVFTLTNPCPWALRSTQSGRPQRATPTEPAQRGPIHAPMLMGGFAAPGVHNRHAGRRSRLAEPRNGELPPAFGSATYPITRGSIPRQASSDPPPCPLSVRTPHPRISDADAGQHQLVTISGDHVYGLGLPSGDHVGRPPQS